jgi:hypothetical protein
MSIDINQTLKVLKKILTHKIEEIRVKLTQQVTTTKLTPCHVFVLVRNSCMVSPLTLNS